MRKYSDILRIRPEVLSEKGIVDMVDLASVTGEGGQRRKSKRRRLADEVPAFESLRDPRAFFELTYPTEDVRQTLETLAARFAEPDSSAGTILLTGRYGLGKSHVLLTAHHALSAPEVVSDWCKTWDVETVELPSDVRVVTRSFIHRGTENLWEVLYDALGASDQLAEVGDYPDGETIEGLLDARPTVLILDELERWYDALDKRKKSRNRNFIQALSEVARRNPRLTVVTSVLGEQPEPAETLRRTRPMELEFRSADDRQRVLLFRLFENHGQHDEGQVAEVVDAYAEAYRGGGLAEVDSYRERMLATYPFTPEFLDILTKKVPNLGGFQNTRGSLRFLARVVRATYEAEPIVSSQHVPFKKRDVQGDLTHLDSSGGEVVRRALGDNYEAVPSDLGHKDALFSAILFYSIADPTHPGITEDELLYAVLDPGENPNEVKDSLRQLRRFAFNLHLLDDRYVFRSQENPQARIHAVAHSQQVTREAAFSVIEEMLLAAWGDNKRTVLHGRGHQELPAIERRLKDLGSVRPMFLISTCSLEPTRRLELQNLHPDRNLVLLIEPRYKPERGTEYAYELLTDAELTARARVIEACRRLLEGKPEASSAAVYRDVRSREESRLKQDIAERYGYYVSWHRSGANDAAVDEEWFDLGHFDEFSAPRFQRWFEREFGGDPIVYTQVKSKWSKYLRRTVSELVEHFETTPGTAIPYRDGMVEDALRKLAREGTLALETSDGHIRCRGTTDRLPAKIGDTVIVDAPSEEDLDASVEELPVHTFVTHQVDPDRRTVTFSWEVPEDVGASQTLIQRYTGRRGYRVGEEHKFDLDQTNEANRGIEAGRSFTDEGLEPGIVYYYYVFLVNPVGQAQRIVLSKQLDVKLPSTAGPEHADTIAIPAQPSLDKLITEVEKRVMSSKHMPRGKVVDRMELQVRGVANLEALDPILSRLAAGSGSARSIAELLFVIRGRYSKIMVVEVVGRLPKIEDARYEALLHLADEGD